MQVTRHAPDIELNAARFAPELTSVRTWMDCLYEHAHATLDHPLRRAILSIGFGCAAYCIGLLVALLIGFAPTYVRTPGVYFVVVPLSFFLWRWQALRLQLVPWSMSIRDMFAVSDQDYADAFNRMGQDATRARVVNSLIGVALLISWAFIALIDLRPHSTPARYVAAFPYPFAGWFTGPQIWGKMFVADLLTAASVAVVIPIAYASVVGLAAFVRAVWRWSVIPVPAQVALRCERLTWLFLLGGLYYALAVMTAVFATGGHRDPLIIGITVALTLIGVVTVLTPFVITHHLTTRAEQELATNVSRVYFGKIYPAGLTDLTMHRSQDGAVSLAAYDELTTLQQLLNEAAKTRGIGSQLGPLIAGVLSQGLGLVPLLLPTLGK